MYKLINFLQSEKKSSPQPRLEKIDSKSLDEKSTSFAFPPPPPLPPTTKPILTNNKNEALPNNTLVNNETKDTHLSLPLNEILTQSKKLRKTDVKRSPGGTSIINSASTSKSKEKMNNNQDLIALALKKKFLNITPVSPLNNNFNNEQDNFNDDWDDYL